MGVLSAIVTAGKLALSFVPNIEIVTLLFMVYTVVFGYRKTILVSIVFTTMEIFIYGFSTWLLGYYIIWPILITVTALMKKRIKSEYGYAAIGAIFGYTFGLFFAVVESFFYGRAYGWLYWIKGIPFDLVHGTANFIIALVLYKYVVNILAELKKIYYRNQS